ncbi:MAG TPA: YafY family protein [Clostridium sp.]
MQINRLFEIVYILLNKKTITAKELAEHFEVSIRTIYRDIDKLTSANIPIYTSQGKGGGITLLDDYILNKSVLSENEQNEILFALQSLTSTQYPEADNIRSKLSSLFNKNKINWIEVDFSSWGNGKNRKEQFNILKSAIISHRVITFEYFNSLGEKIIRRVEPIKLLFKSKSWYLQGFCLSKKADRTFKITRMSDIQITEDSFIKKPPTELSKDTQEQEFVKSVNIRLKIAPAGAYRVLDDFNENEVIKNEDGYFIVSTSLPEGEWLLNYILSFGPVAEVLEPKSMRKIIQKNLEYMIEQYKK